MGWGGGSWEVAMAGLVGASGGARGWGGVFFEFWIIWDEGVEDDDEDAM